MANGDLAATSAGPRTTGPPTWPTRRGKLVGRQYEGASDRTADLTQVRSTPLPADACLTARTTGVVEGYDDMVSHKGSKVVSVVNSVEWGRRHCRWREACRIKSLSQVASRRKPLPSLPSVAPYFPHSVVFGGSGIRWEEKGKVPGHGSGEEARGVGCGGVGDERRQLRRHYHGQQTAHVAQRLWFQFRYFLPFDLDLDLFPVLVLRLEF
ncbi:hypothetical protein GW17_00018294 [Ensete ventricosum]|nr:hypothetical protein GW17_00018294 [Ensete ventricosum]